MDNTNRKNYPSTFFGREFEFLHPGHEIIFAHLLEDDDYFWEYKELLMFELDPEDLDNYSILVNRRLTGLFTEARDRFLKYY